MLTADLEFELEFERQGRRYSAPKNTYSVTNGRHGTQEMNNISTNVVVIVDPTATMNRISER